MKKSIIVLLAGIFFLTGCQRNEVIKTHGIAYLDKREKLIIVNESNKNDTIDILGQPSSKGMTNENTWIYIERTKTRGKLLNFGRNITKKNNVLALKFNDYGVLIKKDFYDKKNINDIKFSSASTSRIEREQSFVYSFLSSIRQKINKPVKSTK